MTIEYTTRIFVAVAGLLGAPVLALTAATPPAHAPLQKTIGQAGAADIVPSLIVMNARGATLIKANGLINLITTARSST
jgi:hypothetical protein